MDKITGFFVGLFHFIVNLGHAVLRGVSNALLYCVAWTMFLIAAGLAYFIEKAEKPE